MTVARRSRLPDADGILGYEIEGVYFETGRTEGRNKWGIDRHVKMYRAILAGGPAYPDNLDYDQSGSSIFWAHAWARIYKKAHGHDPLRFYRPEAIVVHIMSGALQQTARRFHDPRAAVSAHYGVGKNGEVHQYVEENDTSTRPKPLTILPVNAGRRDDFQFRIGMTG